MAGVIKKFTVTCPFYRECNDPNCILASGSHVYCETFKNLMSDKKRVILEYPEKIRA